MTRALLALCATLAACGTGDLVPDMHSSSGQCFSHTNTFELTLDGGMPSCATLCAAVDPVWGQATCAEDGGLFNGSCVFVAGENGDTGVACTVQVRGD